MVQANHLPRLVLASTRPRMKGLINECEAQNQLPPVIDGLDRGGGGGGMGEGVKMREPWEQGFRPVSMNL